MEQGVSHVRADDIEATLCEIAEIKAARVVADADGRILEIHILALPTKAPKQLVRDIESALMARFGIPVDHRKISIAQIGREDRIAESSSGETPRSSAVRPRILAVNASVTGVQASASVSLEIAGTTYLGQAAGPASQSSRQRQVAIATLDAVSQYTGASATFALEDVSVVQLGREKVAVACISLVSPFGEQSFSGSAVLRQTEGDSIVRATLDAINRRIGLLTTA